jgi:hypothetical protein
VKIIEAPGGRGFVDALIEAICDLALLYAGTPDECAAPHLESYIKAIRPTVIDSVGARTAETILDTFRAAVIGEKHLIEASGSSRA